MALGQDDTASRDVPSVARGMGTLGSLRVSSTVGGRDGGSRGHPEETGKSCAL